MTYQKNVWHPGEEGGTIVSAARLNNLETQYDEAVAYTDNAISNIPPPTGGGSERATLTETNAVGSVEVDAGADSFTVIKVTSSAATRVRGYRSAIDRTQDAARPPGARPTSQGAILFEFIFDQAGTFYSTGFRALLAAEQTALYLNVSEEASIDIEIEREKS